MFQYHGAEHKTIHAYEAGDPLTVERIQKYSPAHPRCGTSFLLIVVIGSLIVFTLIGRPGWFLLIASRVVLIPVIAGAAYEVLKFSGLHGGEMIGRILAAPGLWLQKLTTGEPDDDQVEVAVASLLAALEPEEIAEVKGRGPVNPAALAARIRDLADTDRAAAFGAAGLAAFRARFDENILTRRLEEHYRSLLSPPDAESS